MLLLLVASFVVFLLQWPGQSGGQEKPAPLYMFEPEDDLFETYGTAPGTIINRRAIRLIT